MTADRRTVYDLLTEWENLDEGHTLADARADVLKRAYQQSNALRDAVWDKVEDRRAFHPERSTDETLGSRRDPNSNIILRTLQNSLYDSLSALEANYFSELRRFYDTVFAPRGIGTLHELLRAAPTVRGLNIPKFLEDDPFALNMRRSFPKPTGDIYDRWIKDAAWDAKLRRALMKQDRTAYNAAWNAHARKHIDEMMTWFEDIGGFLEMAADYLAKAKNLPLNAAPDHSAVGRFNLINQATAWDFDLELLADALKEAARLVTKAGFGAACYGPVIVIDRFQKHPAENPNFITYAEYTVEGDDIQLSFHDAVVAANGMDGWLKNHRKKVISNLIHELAHRIWFKFLTDTQRNIFAAMSDEKQNNLKQQVQEILKARLTPQEKNDRLRELTRTFVSGYATKNIWEDFAEALTIYITEPSRRREPGVERLYLARIVQS